MLTLSEAYTSHPLHLHQLDLTSFRELPDTHAWPRQNDHPMGDEPVPVVDLHHANRLLQIAHACESWGMFQVTGHGVPLFIIDQAESECWRLFSLPFHHKLKVLRPPNGISGYGIARISTFFSKLMWSEGFTIVDSTVEHARLLWPNDYHRFCEVIEVYNKRMRELSRKLMGLILNSLGLGEEEWPDQYGADDTEAASVLQFNSYPACPDPERAMGLAAHTDSSLITVLHQSSTSGLQVLRPDDHHGAHRWVTVPPMHGALVINVGDLLHILSNGRYRSMLHRAVVNRTNHRLSMAYIHGPPDGTRISPLDGLVGPMQGPAYRAVTWAEYLSIKAKHFDRALVMIRTDQQKKNEV